MKLKELLNERITSTVYHMTSVNNVINILKRDAMRLSAHEYNDPMKYTHFLSLARSKNNSFFKKEVGKAIIEFDGEKLSNNFKGRPLNWFNTIADGDDISFRASSFSETEDRLYSNKDKIVGVIKYIKAIHIIRYKYSRLSVIKKLNPRFPIYVYESKEDFMHGKKGKLL